LIDLSCMTPSTLGKRLVSCELSSMHAVDHHVLRVLLCLLHHSAR
jgi:hypothetical protein